MKKMKSKILAIASAAACCSALQFHAIAAEVPTETVSPMAAGLIFTFSITGEYGYNQLIINGSTVGFEEMAEIGLIDIMVQHSSDKTNWVDEVPVTDMINEDAYSFFVADYAVPVISGYYYRVVVTHYAKEHGWFFPTTQEITAASSPVWIG